MQQLVFTSTGSLAYSSRTGSVVRLSGALGAAAGGNTSAAGEAGAVPTTPVAKGDSGNVAPWGADNLFPQKVKEEAEKNTIIPAVLERKTSFVYGSGIIYGEITGYNEDGTEKFQRIRDEQVEAFFRRSNMSRYGFEGLSNIHWFANAWPELVLNAGRSEIYSLSVVDTVFSRYSVMKPGMAVPELLHISANWADGATPGDEYTTSVPVLDPYFDPAGRIHGDSNVFKYVYPLSLPSPGQSLYQLAAWNSIRRSGWLDVAQAIPEFKKALFKNQLSVKYLIEAHEGYWKWKYPEWDIKSQEQRKQIIDDELDQFEKTMTGVDGAGKSVLSIVIPDPNTPGGTIQAFKVTAIDDKLKSGLYIEDSQEASSHIYTALSFDPTLAGISPGKGMGAGSGSDKRVAFNTFVSTHKFHQDLILEPLYLVRDFNGWNPNLEFRFLNPMIMTLDKGETAPAPAAAGN